MYPTQVSDETDAYVKAYLKVFDAYFFPQFCSISDKQHLCIYLLCIFKHQMFKLSLSKTELTDWTAKIAWEHQSVLRNKILLTAKVGNHSWKAILQLQFSKAIHKWFANNILNYHLISIYQVD